MKRGFLSKLFLLPLSKVYGAVTYMRNKMFDWRVLKEVEFDVPIVTVGNLAVGGTGKTPHVEYIVNAFRDDFKVAVLSRGYRRKTKGFIIAGRTSTPQDIGDEAYQVYHKFGGKVTVAVCEDRVEGVEDLLRVHPDINMIVLDDAFQHRYIKPTVSIVITEYNHPIYQDHLLPYGHLREPARGINRADIVIVSKCPTSMKPMDFRMVKNRYDLFPSQHLFYSHYEYQILQPVFPDIATVVPYLDYLTESDSILAIAGIGNPRPFIRHLKSFRAKVKVDIYPDHHRYTKKDMAHIKSRYEQMKGSQKIIITTEKDAVRLAACPYFPFELKSSIYYLPITVDFDGFENDLTLPDAIRKAIREKKL
ncbi:MAG: tetraacyldisaccharide 4'-kinase [Muribaculaceae bacterium]|nr:tetraacyldisaccharide 4'-kinase [Muribaculaceae bacterium]